jgi:hypothetical protein
MNRGYQSGYWGLIANGGKSAVRWSGERKPSSSSSNWIEEEPEQNGEKPFNRLFAHASRVVPAPIRSPDGHRREDEHPPGTAEIMESVATFVKATKADVHWGGRMALLPHHR